MAGAGNNPQPCAVCRHQRRRCDQNCETAPYLPASTYNDFHNAHKLFGVRNIQKILHQVPRNQRQATAESILKAGNARLDNPVHGSLGIVRGLVSRIHLCEIETEHINRLLAFFHESGQLPQIFDIDDLAMVDSMLNLEPTMDLCKPGSSGKNSMEDPGGRDEEDQRPISISLANEKCGRNQE